MALEPAGDSLLDLSVQGTQDNLGIRPYAQNGDPQESGDDTNHSKRRYAEAQQSIHGDTVSAQRRGTLPEHHAGAAPCHSSIERLVPAGCTATSHHRAAVLCQRGRHTALPAHSADLEPAGVLLPDNCSFGGNCSLGQTPSMLLHVPAPEWHCDVPVSHAGL